MVNDRETREKGNEKKYCPLLRESLCRGEQCMWYNAPERRCAVLSASEYLSVFCDFLWDELVGE